LLWLYSSIPINVGIGQSQVKEVIVGPKSNTSVVLIVLVSCNNNMNTVSRQAGTFATEMME
jgi:hypothetical protein